MKIIALLAFALVGCSTVPQTTIDIDPTTHRLSIKNPKDTQFDSATIKRKSDGELFVEIVGYKSSLNPKAIAEQGKREAAILEQWKGMTDNLAKHAADYFRVTSGRPPSLTPTP